MSRWRHRLAELRLEAHPQPLGAVQNVQNVQSLSSVRTFEHSGQIEQRTEGDAPRLADWRVLSLVLGRPCPDDLSPERWERSRRGVERFAEGWAVQAMRLGWTFEDLFSIAKPFGRVDLQGAAWFVGDATIVAVSASAIVLRTASGAILRVYRSAPV